VFSKPEEIRALSLELPPVCELTLLLKEKGIKLPEGILTTDELIKALKYSKRIK
jgi:hypothetical protein